MSEIPSAVGLAGVVSVKVWAEPEESHSIGRTGAPLAPVTCTRAAAPPSPGTTPGGAGASVSELPSDAVITSSPATLSVMPELVPGIVTGESESIGAVNVFGADFALKGSVFGQSVHPSKLKVMLPLSEYETVDPPGVGVYLTDTGRGPFGVFRSAGSYVSATSVPRVTFAVSVPLKATAPWKRQKPNAQQTRWDCHSGVFINRNARAEAEIGVFRDRYRVWACLCGHGAPSAIKATSSATPNWTRKRGFTTMPPCLPSTGGGGRTLTREAWRAYHSPG